MAGWEERAGSEWFWELGGDRASVSVMTVKTTFRAACREKLGIADSAFEEAVLWRCLPPYHVPVGKLQWRVARGYFKPDLELIRSVANCTSVAGVRTEISYFRTAKKPTGFRRWLLRARVSGQRLVDLATELLPES